MKDQFGVRENVQLFKWPPVSPNIPPATAHFLTSSLAAYPGFSMGQGGCE
jgi:hypothetical protein